MKKNTLKKKAPKNKEWKNFSPDQYNQAAQAMVHFSAKTINSNARAFGIRLAADNYLDLPYMAVKTMQERRDIPLDYYQGGAQSSTIPKQISAVLQNKLMEFSHVHASEQEAIKNCDMVLNQPYQTNDGGVSIRLRQVILQDAQGQDIAVTPLACAGLSVLINQRIKEEWEKESTDRKAQFADRNDFIARKRAYLGIGGANSQNVGLNIYAMQSPIFFEVPSLTDANLEIRQAWSIYHRGITGKRLFFKFNSKILADFIVWQENFQSGYLGENATKLSMRVQEQKFLIQLVKDFMRQVAGAQHLLHHYQDKLPKSRMGSSDLSELDQGFLDDIFRNATWRNKCAEWLHKRLLTQVVWIKEAKKTLKGSLHQTAYWRGIVEEVLL